MFPLLSLMTEMRPPTLGVDAVVVPMVEVPAAVATNVTLQRKYVASEPTGAAGNKGTDICINLVVERCRSLAD